MTFLGIITTLIMGVLILISGILLKKKWVILISIIPLVIAVGQLAMLVLMVL